MPTRQVFTGNINAGSSATGFQIPFTNRGSWTTTQCPITLTHAIDAQHLGIKLSAAAGGGKTWTFDLLKNGSTTAITLAFGATDTELFISTKVSFNAGDTLELRRTSTGTPTAPTNCWVSLVIDNKGSKKSIYGFKDVLNGTVTFLGSAIGARSLSSSNIGILIPLAGTITDASYHVSAAPGIGGSGKQYEFTLMKDNVAQDGAGGTNDTRVVIFETATDVSYSGAGVTFAVSDQHTFRSVPTNTPASPECAVCVSYVTSDSDGKSIIAAGRNAALTNSAGTNYSQGMGVYITGWDATESNTFDYLVGGAFTFQLIALYAEIVLLPPITNALTVSVRVNSADPSGTLSATIPNSGTSANDTAHTVTINPGDNWDLQDVQTGTVGISKAMFVSLVQFALTGGGGAGRGGGRGSRGGGGINGFFPNGTICMNIGNPGVDIGST